MLQEFCVVEEVVMNRKWSSRRKNTQCMKSRRRLWKIPENFLEWPSFKIYFLDTVHLVEAWSDHLHSSGIPLIEGKIRSEGKVSLFWPDQHFLCPTTVVERYIGPEFRRAESWRSPKLWYLTKVGPKPWQRSPTFRKLEYFAQDFNRKARDGRRLVSAF